MSDSELTKPLDGETPTPSSPIDELTLSEKDGVPSLQESESASDSAQAESPPALNDPEVEEADGGVGLKVGERIEGKVIGWNNGGLHVVVGDLTAFCPRSEIEIGLPLEAESYLDQVLQFVVLKIQKQGRRVVLSRIPVLRKLAAAQRKDVRKKLEVGKIVTGRVASLTDFGAFVDLGGIQGMIHISELGRQRIQHPSDVLQEGQEVEVKIVKIEEGGKRIGLSTRALEPDPWREVRTKYVEGSQVVGKVEKVADFGAFIELEPGLSGLLPTSSMGLPREASAARAYPVGKEVTLQVVAVDSRRQRISLGPLGSSSEGSSSDFKKYIRDQEQSSSAEGFNALAAALSKLKEP